MSPQGYLYPALDRPNLKVLTGALVSRVLTAKQAGALAATGVEFVHGGQTYSVGVAKDAILSARCVSPSRIVDVYKEWLTVTTVRSSPRRSSS